MMKNVSLDDDINSIVNDGFLEDYKISQPDKDFLFYLILMLVDKYRINGAKPSNKSNEPTTTDHSYYNDKNGKDLFYHFKNGIMNTEMYKGFLVGNIFKYITRHGKKDKSKTIEDLKKARDYLNELIDFEEATMDESAEG